MSAATVVDLRSFYRGRRVLITGHTGFKGGWLTSWLAQLGAEVNGLALAPDHGPDNLFETANLSAYCRSSRIGDIGDQTVVFDVMNTAQPTIVFHLAARALIQQGFQDPVLTFATNTLGTAIVLEASRRTPSVQAVVCVTTDKVYNNSEWVWPFRETDELGGRDAYSASKAGAELVARAYQGALKPTDRRFTVATARGGNVIGGGDWSPHRIIPDIVRSIRAGQALELRLPGAVRPWQHVLDLCYGYLLLGRHLVLSELAETVGAQSAWNFGPSVDENVPVGELADMFLEAWGRPDYPRKLGPTGLHEALTLRLDASLANRYLSWRPALNVRSAIGWTAEWYRDYLADTQKASGKTLDQIYHFEQKLESREAQI